MAIAIVILVLIVAIILCIAATRPDSFRIERSTNINASPEKIFTILNDFHQWDNWSPWEKMDTSMKKTHSGANAGPGAVYEWEGNSQVGKGRMEITTAATNEKITIKLEFFKPFAATNTAEFTLMSNSTETQVTWAMFGPSPYGSKLMGLFFSMERMVGKQFEEGLTNLKALTEKA